MGSAGIQVCIDCVAKNIRVGADCDKQSAPFSILLSKNHFLKFLIFAGTFG